jgi:hypothetical protein
MSGQPNGNPANNCQYDVATGANGQGCGDFSKNSVSYGTPFNNNGGGVYATEWTSDYIKIWFFPRQQIPSDIASGSPNPSNWGIPDSIFNGQGCDIDTNFNDNRIVFDTTFCGDFGDATWSVGGANSCASITGQQKCSNAVGNYPGLFEEAYWDINYVKVFQSKPVTTTTTTTVSHPNKLTKGRTGGRQWSHLLAFAGFLPSIDIFHPF